MQSFRSHVAGKANTKAACMMGYVHPSVRCHLRRAMRAVGALSESANGNGKVHNKQLKFFYFDPANPEEVREIVAKHTDKKSHYHPSNNGNGNGLMSNGFSAIGHHNTNGGTAVARTNGHSTGAQLTQVKDSSKELAQLQRLSAQLEEARSAAAKLQQFEVLYKESRMRSKQMQVEVSSLQQLLAEKDAELARQYKRMEVEATERSGLRTQFNSAIDEVKALRNELEEARQAMLELRGVIPANVTLRRGARPAALLDEANGSAPSGTNPDVLSSLHGLAKQLAEGMEHEVGTLFGASGKREV